MLTDLSNWQVRNMPYCNDVETFLLNCCAGLSVLIALAISIAIWRGTKLFTLSFGFGIVLWFVIYIVFGFVALEGYDRIKAKRNDR